MGALIDYTGHKIGRLAVLGRAENKSGKVRWSVRCDCGAEKVVAADSLRQRKTVSCGCLRNERVREKLATHGMSGSKEYEMWGSAKKRAAQRGMPFDISVGDIEIPMNCPLLGIAIDVSSGPQRPGSPSLDRIDPSGGYTKGNIWVVSNRANTIKSDATLDELRMLVANLESRDGA